VTIEALEDSRLVGSGQAARWELASPGDVGLFENGAVVQDLDRPVERGQRYTVWSYVPPVKPKELNGAGTSYAPELDRFLRAQPSFDLAPLPPYGTPGRERRLNALFLQESYMADHRVLWDAARRIAAEAATPYQAAVAVEAWFRGEEGGFVYDESPPFAGTAAPLPFFLESKRGYCQHFAGAMALMLRYLGIPARVAAGFTSGTYDQRTKEWTVTDHNAHTWVEVYFPRFGWIPFDPTPNRGELSASYSPFSPAFDAAEAAGLGEGFGSIPEVAERIDRAAGLEQREGASSGGGAGGGVPGAVAETGGSILGGLLLLVGGAGALIVLVKEARRRARFAARDPRALAAACRRDLAGYLADQGVAVAPSATPRELGEIAERALGVDARRFVGALAEARYGPPRDARSRARRARTELRRLRGSMRRRLGTGQRLRGAVSLRSLSV
jgi:protein-glutamine gamma-glutamyltransferase